MNSKSTLNPSSDFKRLHLCGIVWFLLCIAFLFVFSLYQMGYHFWVTFSISTYSAVIVLFLMTVYLFAFYKGVVRNSNSIEHPLTTSPYYVLLYDSSPFMGFIAGLFAGSFNQSVLSVLSTAAQGTLLMTFAMWIVLDSLTGLAEASFPKSVEHRKQRIAETYEKKRLHTLERQTLLEQINLEEKKSRSEWMLLFQPYAVEVADLLCVSSGNVKAMQKRIIELGALAWRQGGLLPMQLFYTLISEELKGRIARPSVDFVTLYWDGIGNWRRPDDLNRLYTQPQS